MTAKRNGFAAWWHRLHPWPLLHKMELEATPAKKIQEANPKPKKKLAWVPDLIHRCMYCLTVIPVEVFRVYLQWHVKRVKLITIQICAQEKCQSNSGFEGGQRAWKFRRRWNTLIGPILGELGKVESSTMDFEIHIFVHFILICNDFVSTWKRFRFDDCVIFGIKMYKTLEWRVTVYILNHLDASFVLW